VRVQESFRPNDDLRTIEIIFSWVSRLEATFLYFTRRK
jgi:hypothetical protein